MLTVREPERLQLVPRLPRVCPACPERILPAAPGALGAPPNPRSLPPCDLPALQVRGAPRGGGGAPGAQCGLGGLGLRLQVRVAECAGPARAVTRAPAEPAGSADPGGRVRARAQVPPPPLTARGPRGSPRDPSPGESPLLGPPSPALWTPLPRLSVPRLLTVPTFTADPVVSCPVGGGPQAEPRASSPPCPRSLPSGEQPLISLTGGRVFLGGHLFIYF